MVHQYKLNGYNIVLDTASGSVHTVDEVAYDIIGMFENTPYPGLREVLETLKAEGHTLYVASSKPEWMCVEIL